MIFFAGFRGSKHCRRFFLIATAFQFMPKVRECRNVKMEVFAVREIADQADQRRTALPEIEVDPAQDAR